MATLIIDNTPVLVDDEDLVRVQGFAWKLLRRPRARTAYVVAKVGGRKSLVQMHRVIADAPPGLDVDHRSGDGLDNRRANLRVCEHARNCQNGRLRRSNRSGFKGVYFDPSHRGKQYRAEVMAFGKKHRLGWFETAAQAHAAYVAKATELHGEYARAA